MVLTNRHMVLIRKPAGEYWVLDRQSGSWRKLGGGQGLRSSLREVLSDGSRAAYVCRTNIFVERPVDRSDPPAYRGWLGHDRHGTSDWV